MVDVVNIIHAKHQHVNIVSVSMLAFISKHSCAQTASQLTLNYT